MKEHTISEYGMVEFLHGVNYFRGERSELALVSDSLREVDGRMIGAIEGVQEFSGYQ